MNESAATLDADFDYCLDQLRRLDRDRYLTVVAAPESAAADLAVLYALNLELAVIPESVSEPMLGRIRLQWWREAIDELYAGRVRRHAVLTPLAALLARRRLGRGHFERLIAARESIIDGEQPADLDALRRFAADSSASLLALAAEAAGLDPAAAGIAPAIQSVGIGFALTGIARSTLHLAARRRSLLPVDLVERHGVSVDRLYDLRPQAELKPLVAALAAAAQAHLEEARRVAVPPELLPALRIGTLARAQLARLARRGHDLFDPRSIEGSPLDIWRLALRRMAGSW